MIIEAKSRLCRACVFTFQSLLLNLDQTVLLNFLIMKNPKACYLLLFALLCCKKPYNPPATTINANYLVVEGAINTGPDSTVIKLSRTVKLSSANVANPELHASVMVVSSTNATYPLTETGKGYYRAPGLNLSPANTYSLKIITSNGKVYQSDFLAEKNSPPIDSVNYKVQNNQVNINVNAHDPANKTIYYRWDYVETYIIHSYFDTDLKLQTVPFDTVVIITPPNQIFVCWPSDTSSTVLLGSTAKLRQDVISQSTIASIPLDSYKFSFRYSILVKQYALSPEAYNYWRILKTNTEQLGTIFDAQPSEPTGNIHCVTTPSEPVIGYLSVGAVSQLRVYINNGDLPFVKNIVPLSIDGCLSAQYLFRDSVGFATYVNDVQDFIYTGQQYPIAILPARGGPIVGYDATDRFCADCTLRGPNVQPSFWTN